MGIRVTLGWHFDGGAYPNPSGGEAASIGALVVGPTRFLDFLARRIGLGRAPMPEPVRIGAFLRRLSSVRTPGCFFDASFTADRWSTAKLLLAWRDELYASGWTGTVSETAPVRLRTLAQIETVHDILLGPSDGEVLQEILTHLPNVRIKDLLDITLAEPRDLWPPLWKRLFAMLVSQGIVINEIALNPAADTGDLAALQRFLLNRIPAEFQGDGSLVAIEANSELDAAEAVADWLAADRDANERVVIIRGRGSALLDSRLHGLELPQIGIGVRSPWRAAMQVLPLAFELHWDPLDPYRLLEFLNLPHGPIPRSAARRLTQALQEHPGIGGPLWMQALEDAIQIRERKLREKGLDGTALAQELKAFRERLSLWLPATRYPPEPGIPVNVARAICTRVAQWSALRAEKECNELMGVVGGQAMTLDRVFEVCGLDQIPRPVLHRMLDAVIGDGIAIPRFETEAAPWSVVDRPEQIYGTADAVVWLDFSASDPGVRYAPWTAEERRCLADLGVTLDDRRTRWTRDRLGWVRAVLAARRNLLLVSSRPTGGEAPMRHPLFDEMCTAFPKASATSAFVDNLATLRHGPSAKLAHRTLECEEVMPHPLPPPRRLWSVPSRLPRPSHDSPTGIEALLQCSFRWALKTYAKIRVGRALALPSENQMIGTFCHAIFERLFRERSDWTPAEAGSRADVLFQEMAPQMAAPLLLPGRELDRQRIAEEVRHAVKMLVDALATGRLRVEGVETPLSKPLTESGPIIQGKVDMLIRDAAERPIVLDLKWVGSARRRLEQMRGGTPVQLASYTWLVSDATQAQATAGFYLMRQGRLIMADDWPLPEHHVEGTDLPQLWRDVVAAYEAGLAALATGRVYATGVDDGSAEEDYLPFTLDPPCPSCEYQPLCQANPEEE